ncbi:hypothetical protein [Bacillus mycoides]|uniref:hypothetical protein n=1 Tax=Bacillus mycoides TaxID=1405 RepID=UPI001301A814|nr:hypothetical protein [Bacillus mycoides]
MKLIKLSRLRCCKLVVPLVGTWIEIWIVCRTNWSILVAPLVGAGIEILIAW